jgi:hypothetical protein
VQAVSWRGYCLVIVSWRASSRQVGGWGPAAAHCHPRSRLSGRRLAPFWGAQTRVACHCRPSERGPAAEGVPKRGNRPRKKEGGGQVFCSPRSCALYFPLASLAFVSGNYAAHFGPLAGPVGGAEGANANNGPSRLAASPRRPAACVPHTTRALILGAAGRSRRYSGRAAPFQLPRSLTATPARPSPALQAINSSNMSGKGEHHRDRCHEAVAGGGPRHQLRAGHRSRLRASN